MLPAAVTSYKGLQARRFFLGFSESIVLKAFMVIISGYYAQSKQTSWQCAWYSLTSSWTVLGVMINYGFAFIRSVSLHTWQCLYLLIGAITSFCGLHRFFIPKLIHMSVVILR
jgi:hypothetical protein